MEHLKLFMTRINIGKVCNVVRDNKQWNGASMCRPETALMSNLMTPRSSGVLVSAGQRARQSREAHDGAQRGGLGRRCTPSYPFYLYY